MAATIWARIWHDQARATVTVAAVVHLRAVVNVEDMHAVAVLRIYAKCIAGQDELAKRRISEALRQDRHDAGPPTKPPRPPVAGGKAVGTRSGSCAVPLKALSDPDLDDGLPGNAEAPRFPVQGLDHP
jgi:hypothetical protein